jgi:hypothetical protein
MPSPKFDALHLYLSRKLQDPVTAASSDGVPFSSLMRTDYLNRANNFIQLLVTQAGREYVNRFLPGLITTQAVVWVTGGTSLATDYKQFLSCQYTPSTGNPVLLRYVGPSWKIVLDNDQNRNYDAAFTILDGKIYGYYNFAQLITGNGVLYYLKTDYRTSSGDTLDISIDPMWWDTLVDLAASFALEDRGNSDFAQMNTKRTAMVTSLMGIK